MKHPERPPSAFAFIALGSNLGNSRDTLLRAMDCLEALSAAPLLRSSLWRSTPVDCPPGSPPFINAVAGLIPRSGVTPEGLLTTLQSLERRLGRLPKKSLNEPRPLDLDLIAWGDAVRSTPALTLPHPRAHRRRFVLQPLAEIAPEFVLPGQTRPVAKLLAELQTDEVLTRID
jgi:2-amino-4-hydroxy-6-hydroxymethyldihydropteridine diphosphokinase